MIHVSFLQFAELAIQNAIRCAIQQAEFTPRIDGLVIGVSDTQLLGARVFFEPPVKSVWVSPNGFAVYGEYETKRKEQLPLTATYYLFDNPAALDMYVEYTNGSPEVL